MTLYVEAAGLFLSCGAGKQRRWLLLKNRKRQDWGFPKGHVEPGESLIQTALRECAEETGIALFMISGVPFELSYNVRIDRHKTVHYFPAETECLDVQLSKEHAAYAWMEKNKVLKSLPHPTIRALFKQYLKQEAC